MLLFARMVLLAAGLAAVAGCARFERATPPDTQVSDGGTTAEEPATVAAVPYLPPAPRKPAPPPDNRVAVLAPEPAPIDPERLVGFAEAEMTAQFGTPATIRQEGLATIWRYAAEQCRMDVFFYADLATGEKRVLTYEIETEPGLADDRCLKRLQIASGKNG